jgi:hypothetical protein
MREYTTRTLLEELEYLDSLGDDMNKWFELVDLFALVDYLDSLSNRG